MIADLGESIQISNLSEYRSWIPTVARWHHNEWLRTHHGLEGSDRSPEVIARKLGEREKALLRHLSEEPLPTTLVAHKKGEPVGTVSLVYYQFSNEQTSTEWLTNLFVQPRYRRRGIASELLQSAIDHAVVCKIPRLLLYTSDQREFYRKRSWRSINRGIVQGQKVYIMDYCLK